MKKSKMAFWCFAIVGLSILCGGSLGESKCDISSGSWVHDPSYPLYDSKGCPFIKGEFNCQKFGRPDTDYLKWKWSPSGCQIPRFDGQKLLEYLRGKTLLFVGDSLAENQWYSMICLLHSTVPKARTDFAKGVPLSHFSLPDYGIQVMFHRAPYLVDIVRKTVKGSAVSVLQVDSVAENSLIWKNATVLVFNSGHWWQHAGADRGYDLIEEAGIFYRDMDQMKAYRKGLTTWANWVDSNLSAASTKVFFRGFSPLHSNKCYNFRKPYSSAAMAGPYPVQFAVAESVVKSMKYPINYLNVTLMSMMRPDAHPSVYSDSMTEAQKRQPQKYSDCSHWCVGGLPDIWNELFSSVLLSLPQ